MAVVHGDGPLGGEGLADLFCPGGVHGVCAAHGNHHQVYLAHSLQLRLGELMPQVSQMGGGESSGGKDPDGVLAPQGAALAVMEGGNLPYGKGALPRGQRLRQLHGAVVKVLVAAKHLVRGGPQGRVALYAGVGVQ